MKCILIAAVITLAYGATWRSRNADLYMDAILNTYLPAEGKSFGLNPAHLPNFNTTIKVPVFGKKTAKFGNGNVTGLTDLYRRGNCSGPAYVRNNISINCTLAFRGLNISYKGEVSIVVNKKFDVKANTTNSYLAVELISNPHSNIPALKSMVAYGLGITKSKVTGLGPGNASAQKSLEDSFNSNATIYLHNLVNNQFRFALNNAVRRIPLPLP